jgi:plastocyanin
MSVTNGTHPVRRLGAACTALAIAAGLSACGSLKRYDNPDVVGGKVAFVSQCGACHTLARAGTKGTIGPNLDAAFAAAVQDGLGRSSIEGVVHGQILEPNPNGVMPRGLVSGSNCVLPGSPKNTAVPTRGQCINDISAYVSQAAAAPGQDTGLLAEAVHPAGTGPPAVEKSGNLAFAADPNGQLSYTTKKATATAGPVTFTMKNTAGIPHNIALQAGATGATPGPGPVLGAGAVVNSGGTSTFHATLKPGVYTFFCQVPGHRAGGMWGTLTVK